MNDNNLDIRSLEEVQISEFNASIRKLLMVGNTLMAEKLFNEFAQDYWNDHFLMGCFANIDPTFVGDTLQVGSPMYEFRLDVLTEFKTDCRKLIIPALRQVDYEIMQSKEYAYFEHLAKNIEIHINVDLTSKMFNFYADIYPSYPKGVVIPLKKKSIVPLKSDKKKKGKKK